LKHFIDTVGEENFKKIEILEMNLDDPESFINALEGVTHVLHVASPIRRTGDYNSFIDPVK